MVCQKDCRPSGIKAKVTKTLTEQLESNFETNHVCTNLRKNFLATLICQKRFDLKNSQLPGVLFWHLAYDSREGDRSFRDTIKLI